MYLKFNNKIYEPLVYSKSNKLQVEIEPGVIVGNISRIDHHLFKINNQNFFRAEDKKNIYISNGDEYYIISKLEESNKEYLKSDADLGVQEVFSPMPGSVVKIMVKNGENVSEGDPLIIIEAMKMETTIYSSMVGIISNLEVEQGQQIDTDKMLLKVSKI